MNSPLAWNSKIFQCSWQNYKKTKMLNWWSEMYQFIWFFYFVNMGRKIRGHNRWYGQFKLEPCRRIENVVYVTDRLVPWNLKKHQNISFHSLPDSTYVHISNIFLCLTSLYCRSIFWLRIIIGTIYLRSVQPLFLLARDHHPSFMEWPSLSKTMVNVLLKSYEFLTMMHLFSKYKTRYLNCK